MPGYETTSSLAGWTPDGRILVRKGTSTEMPMRLFALDPGHRPGGALARVLSVRRDRDQQSDRLPVNAPNGAYAYSYFRNLSNLYLVEGLK